MPPALRAQRPVLAWVERAGLSPAEGDMPDREGEAICPRSAGRGKGKGKASARLLAPNRGAVPQVVRF